jgi:AFG3 family protein
MPQEDLKPNDKTNFSRFRPRGDDDGSGGRKGPKFSIYWIWGIIAAVLIGFNLFGGLSPDAHQTEEYKFRKDMLAKGDVDKIDLVSNKQVVRVYIKKDSLQKPFYSTELKSNGWSGGPNKDGPQFEFKVTDVKEYEKVLRDYFIKNPQLEVAINSKSEGEWFGPLLNILLPLLIIVLIWVMLMRKMGGQAGSGGPGGIFNIGKSKATLFD